MIIVFKYADLGTFTNDWLQSRYHLSFGDYRNPHRVRFGNLRGLNENTIAPGKGFDFHPNQDIEIITYVHSGTLIHRDSLGNDIPIKAGSLSILSAGTGIVHSAFANEENEAKIIQIWITPSEYGALPRLDITDIPMTPVSDTLHLLMSGYPEDSGHAIHIHQNAALFSGVLKQNTVLTHHPKGSRIYALIIEGEAVIEGTPLHQGDGAEITDSDTIAIEALSQTSHILLIET